VTRPRMVVPVLAAVGLLGLAACGVERAVFPGQAVSDEAVILVERGAGASRPGDRLAVVVRAHAAGARRVAAFDGTLRFDPDELRFVGQAPQASGFSVVNGARAGAGTLVLTAVAPEQGDTPQAVLVFEQVRHGGDGTLALAPGTAWDSAAVPVTVRSREATRSDLPAPAVTEPPGDGVARWARAHAIRSEVAIAARGPFMVYGDLNGTGSVTSGDLVLVANASVGNLRALGDGLVAANVAPANLPGLGEPGDGLPPGTELDGRRRITSGDVLLLSNYLVGNSVAVVGQPVPPERLGPRVVVTPTVLDGGVATAACTARIAAGTQWLDAAQGIPVAECVDGLGRPMVAQFCAYVKDAAGTWTGEASTASAPRCVAELPGVSRGWL